MFAYQARASAQSLPRCSAARLLPESAATQARSLEGRPLAVDSSLVLPDRSRWIVLTAAVLGVFVVGGSRSWARNCGDGLPQQLDRPEDRGDHHDHHAGDADRQNVI